MARLAMVAEQELHMVRVCRDLIVCLMTLITIHIHKLVVPVDMARLAGERNMCPGQWEIGQRVVKRRRRPSTRRVTLCAVVAEISRCVIRICYAAEIVHMTAVAVGLQALVLVVHMAVSAGGAGVCTCQLE